MRPLFALLLWLLLAGTARPPTCPQPSDFQCAIGELGELRLRGGIATARRIIVVPPEALPLERPLAVRVAGLASSEVYWNGRLIGRNGVPGTSRAEEVPGRYFATFTVPPSLVRPGGNLVVVRLSAQHLWLPVERPVHILEVGRYETPELPGRSEYLPALLALGAIAAGFFYFAAAAWGGAGRGVRLAAAFAGVALLQLLVEVSRAFLVYTYPWALGRVTAIALLAAAAAVLMAAYSARRFMPTWRPAVLAAAAACTASVLLVPWFDFKAMGAILAGALAASAAGIVGLHRGVPRAGWAVAAGLAIMVSMAWEATDFLNTAWYLIVAGLLALLLVEQLGQLRGMRAEAARAAALEARLRRAEETGEPILALKDGTRTHRVAEGDILYIRAADDYCEVVLADARRLLVTMNLSRLLATLPPGFVRVHKSYAVNRGHVAASAPRPGGGRLLKLSDGSALPVGRRYRAAAAALAG